MPNYFIRDLKPFIEDLMEGYVVIAPLKAGNHHDYVPLESAEEFKLDYVNTLFPPKKYLFAYEETLLSFSKGKPKAAYNSTKRAFFGIRPCDIHGIRVLDAVFLQDYVDPYYKAKRENSIIVGIECEKPGENCYCQSLGTYKVDGGYDLLLTPVKGGFIARAGSAAGKALVRKKYFEKTDMDDHAYPKSNEFKAERLENYDDYYHDELWKSEAERCLSCAACTVACPTCTCFSIEDEVNTPDAGARKRYWASCQLKSFSEVAGGHTFRKEVYRRLRHFACHKLHWSVKQYGTRMCVGCGRCVTVCPTMINIFRITNNLGGKKNG